MKAANQRPTRVRLRRFLFTSVVLAVAGIVAYCSWYADRYPYGRTHACDKLLYLMLIEYAESNNGAFPAGQATPEASLSLLYRIDPNIAYLLAGKSASEEDAEALLASGQLLDPSTCSWHYVEGLRRSDDPHLALFWDKIGSRHHGERMPDGGHNVWFINGPSRWISAEEWPKFLEVQRRLLPNRSDISSKVLEQR